jgi:tRNA G37 N-methylase TrmD
VTTVQDLEVTVTSHIDVCAVRYEAINARLKRLERTVVSVGGTIIVILLGALGAMSLMLLEALQK